MELLELYDLTKSFIHTAELCGVDPKTVRKAVAERDAGASGNIRKHRETVSDPYLDKICEWVERSSGRVRGDIVHQKLVAMGYSGSERTTRRVVRYLKASYRHDQHRVYKPWIPEPGMWLQYDFGDGPVVAGRPTTLFCAWLAWSRYRVIIALSDKTMPSVIAALDQTFRIIGGAPTYLLTDNERSVTTSHVANTAVRNRTMLAASLYYGTTLATCVPYDPESKGGSESTVKLAKADILPTDFNLRGHYASFVELEAACVETMDRLNGRMHSVTKRVPETMLSQERETLHATAKEPYSLALGTTRSISWSSTISYSGARYSVPHAYCGLRAWVRTSGDEVIIAFMDEHKVTREIARHVLVSPGEASILDEHYPKRPSSPTDRPPRATNAQEARFLGIGHGASRWLIEACASGVTRIPTKMGRALELTDRHGEGLVDEALSICAMTGRFATGDIESILAARQRSDTQGDHSHREHTSTPDVDIRDIDTLQVGTSTWEGFGR